MLSFSDFFNQKWGLFVFFEGVINFTNLNYNDVLNMNIIEFLNIVSFLIDKNKKDEELRKKYLKS